MHQSSGMLLDDARENDSIGLFTSFFNVFKQCAPNIMLPLGLLFELVSHFSLGR